METLGVFALLIIILLLIAYIIVGGVEVVEPQPKEAFKFPTFNPVPRAPDITPADNHIGWDLIKRILDGEDLEIYYKSLEYETGSIKYDRAGKDFRDAEFFNIKMLAHAYWYIKP